MVMSLNGDFELQWVWKVYCFETVDETRLLYRKGFWEQRLSDKWKRRDIWHFASYANSFHGNLRDNLAPIFPSFPSFCIARLGYERYEVGTLWAIVIIIYNYWYSAGRHGFQTAWLGHGMIPSPSHDAPSCFSQYFPAYLTCFLKIEVASVQIHRQTCAGVI